MSKSVLCSASCFCRLRFCKAMPEIALADVLPELWFMARHDEVNGRSGL